MSGINWIYSYYQQIKDGSVHVGRWIRLLYEYIVAGLENGTFLFDQKRANDAIEWIEAHTFHVEGPLAPGPLKLEVWEKAMLSLIYGIINPRTKCRQFREVLLLIARKNGKSILASAIGNYEFRKNGGYGARVYNVAPKLEQADIV